MGKQGKGAKRRHNQHQQLVKFGVKRKVRITDIHIDLFVYLVGSFLGVEDVLNLVLTCRDFRSSIVNNLSTIRSYMDNLYSYCLAVCKSGLPCKLQRKRGTQYCHIHQNYTSNGQFYQIDDVLDWKYQNGSWYGYVKWKGFYLACSWEQFELVPGGWRVVNQ